MKTFEKLAMEVAKNLFFSVEDNEIVEFATRFLAAVDAERGKDAVCHLYRDMYSGGKNGVLRVCRVTPSDDAFPVFLSPMIPEGWKLLKDTTQEERSWPEDSSHENGKYYNLCCHCGRTFIGYKRRGLCKVCAELAAGVTK